MQIIRYKQTEHKQIMQICAQALKQGKVVVYPTDTCYGLAVDSLHTKAVNKLYIVKGRKFNNPVSVVVPSVSFAKKIVSWDKTAKKLSKQFWPGALTLVLPLKSRTKLYKKITANSKFLAVRMPKNRIALDLAKKLGKPITATSANLAGKPESYSLSELLKQFEKNKYKPDIIIDTGKLKKVKPSTLVKIIAQKIELLRPGPVSESRIRRVLEN